MRGCSFLLRVCVGITGLFATAAFWNCSSSGSSSGDSGLMNEAGSDGQTLDASLDAGTEAASASPCAVGTPACKASGCKVFETMTGSLQSGAGMSLATADQSCQSEAAQRGLTGTFKAWLSSGACSAAARFTHNTVPYISVDNQNLAIATNWTQLISGTLAAAISPSVGHPYVGTGTNADGTTTSMNTCNDWTGHGVTYPGDPTATNGSWTMSSAGFQSCLTTFSLYCFEQ